jgi:hypothetical protein
LHFGFRLCFGIRFHFGAVLAVALRNQTTTDPTAPLDTLLVPTSTHAYRCSTPDYPMVVPLSTDPSVPLSTAEYLTQSSCKGAAAFATSCRASTGAHTCSHTHTHTHTHTHSHSHSHSRAHTDTHTHTHRYIMWPVRAINPGTRRRLRVCTRVRGCVHAQAGVGVCTCHRLRYRGNAMKPL